MGDSMYIGHKTVLRSHLAPDRSPSFSPNLFRWLSRQGHFFQDGGLAEGVFRVRPGTATAKTFGAGRLFIGRPLGEYPGDADFSGVRLMSALCDGARAGRWCFSGMAPDLEEVPEFWDRYLKIGRCAIDPAHQEHFSGGERYRLEGNRRTCLWCGATQHRHVTRRVVEDVSWR